MIKIKQLLIAIRPKHWSKNLLIFVVPLLAFKFDISVWTSCIYTFFVFNMISSAIYLLNDCLDVNVDRLHPTKKFRPIASGLLSINQALICFFILLSGSLIFSLNINLTLFLVILVYFIVQLLYCLKLKKVPLLDIFCIAAGFLLRSISGGIAANLIISPWFILSVGLLALFLGLEKRKAELRLYETSGILTRDILNKYSIPLLLRFESVVTTGSFMTYALWASGPSLNGASTSWMLLTVPFVLIGIFRYQFLSDPSLQKKLEIKTQKIDCENPVNILYKDNFIKFI